MRWISGLRERFRTVFFRGQEEADLHEELRFHLEMETEANLRRGMEPKEARRQAQLTLGGMEQVKEEVRDARGLGWVSGLSLDFKLGTRMLIKYPGLTLVGGLSLTVALGLAAAWFEFANDFVNPNLPLEDGDRIVAIRNWDAAAAAPERQSIHDFVTWRE